MNQPILIAENVCKYFPSPRAGLDPSLTVQAVDNVSFKIGPGETLGLVGESGSGKSTLGRALLQLDPPTGGKVYFNGGEITGLSNTALRPLRRNMQMVFQDPQSSLNPRMKVSEIVAEPLIIAGEVSGRAATKARVEELLDMVRLPASAASRYPQEFSGGQRQRIGIARAIALRPRLIVADEAVSSLDVSIQAQIINLLMDLQGQLGFACLFIAHDLAVVRHVADRVAVMFLGRLVELAPTDSLFAHPQHPYTRTLLDAAPIPDPVIEMARQRSTETFIRCRYPAELTEIRTGHFAAPSVPEQL